MNTENDLLLSDYDVFLTEKDQSLKELYDCLLWLINSELLWSTPLEELIENPRLQLNWKRFCVAHHLLSEEAICSVENLRAALSIWENTIKSNEVPLWSRQDEVKTLIGDIISANHNEKETDTQLPLTLEEYLKTWEWDVNYSPELIYEYLKWGGLWNIHSSAALSILTTNNSKLRTSIIQYIKKHPEEWDSLIWIITPETLMQIPNEFIIELIASWGSELEGRLIQCRENIKQCITSENIWEVSQYQWTHQWVRGIIEVNIIYALVSFMKGDDLKNIQEYFCSLVTSENKDKINPYILDKINYWGWFGGLLRSFHFPKDSRRRRFFEKLGISF